MPRWELSRKRRKWRGFSLNRRAAAQSAGNTDKGHVAKSQRGPVSRLLQTVRLTSEHFEERPGGRNQSARTYRANPRIRSRLRAGAHGRRQPGDCRSAQSSRRSSTVIEAVVPYAEPALAEWLGGKFDQACSEPTARAMAMAAFERARRLSAADPHTLCGIGATASLATNRPKRGPHRAFVAWQSADATVSFACDFIKGRRKRSEEESLAAELVLHAVAEACGVNSKLPARVFGGGARNPPGETRTRRMDRALAWRTDECRCSIERSATSHSFRRVQPASRRTSPHGRSRVDALSTRP